MYSSPVDIGLAQVPSNVEDPLLQAEFDAIYAAIHRLNAALTGGSGGTPGIGDVIADSTVSSNGGIVIYSSTDGKHISIFTGTGIPKLTAGGVLTIATAGVGNDYLAGNTQHNSLQGLDVDDYQHLAAAAKNALIGGGITELHQHPDTTLTWMGL